MCESMFEKVMRRRNIIVDLTILFADLRGFTEISEAVDQDRLRVLLDFFYDECAAAIWEQDGLLNKTIGDAVMAIFNFPLGHSNHPVRAVGTAREIQRRCAERCKRMSAEAGLETRGLGVGIGIHTGPTAFGEFGTAHREAHCNRERGQYRSPLAGGGGGGRSSRHPSGRRPAGGGRVQRHARMRVEGPRSASHGVPGVRGNAEVGADGRRSGPIRAVPGTSGRWV